MTGAALWTTTSSSASSDHQPGFSTRVADICFTSSRFARSSFTYRSRRLTLSAWNGSNTFLSLMACRLNYTCHIKLFLQLNGSGEPCLAGLWWSSNLLTVNMGIMKTITHVEWLDALFYNKAYLTLNSNILRCTIVNGPNFLPSFAGNVNLIALPIFSGWAVARSWAVVQVGARCASLWSDKSWLLERCTLQENLIIRKAWEHAKESAYLK